MDDLAIKRLETRLGFRIPRTLGEAFKTYGSAIDFDANITFAPIERSGLEDERGELGLDMFYGPCPDEHGLESAKRMYGDQIAPAFAVLAPSDFGDQICIEIASGQIFIWHHEAECEGETFFLVAHSFDEFLKALRVRPDEPVDLSGIDWDRTTPLKT